MKKNLLLCLLVSTLVAGCGKTTNDSSSNSNEEGANSNSSSSSSETIVDSSNSSSESALPERDYYATVNSEYDIIHIYGIVGETFDLSSINTSKCFNGQAVYETDNDGLQISGDTLKFLKKGTYELNAYFKGVKRFKLQIVVNENEENRLAYPGGIDLNNYTQHSGDANNVVIDNDSITLTAVGNDMTTWNRVVYNLDKKYSTNYTFECDATFINTADPTRWLGIVFRDQETKGNKYPYFQFDMRQSAAASNSVELTYVYGNGSYSYPYSGTWEDGNNLTMTDKIHVKFTLKDSLFNGTLTYGNHSTHVETTLPTVTSGGIGFQCAASTVKFENIKITLDDSIRLSSSADTKDSIVNIDNDTDALKPNMIGSGIDIDEMMGVSLNTQQFYVKSKDSVLYTINDEKMDITLNEIFFEMRGLLIPNIQVEDEKSLKDVAEVCNSYGIIDLNIWSTKGEILDLARTLIPAARLGYIPTNVKSYETYDEIGALCRETGKHYANMIMLDSKLINKENVIKTVGLGYTVVANANTGDDYSVIRSTLAGCKLILSRFTRNVLNQSKLIYNDEVFNKNDKVSSLLSVPYATGHRGAGTNGSNPAVTLPENTIESFKWAYDNGANAIEIDIHETFDGKLAVIHNAETGEYSNTNLVVRNSTLAQLQSIPLKVGSAYSSDYHIPSLDEVFTAFSGDEYKDKTIVIEVKDTFFETGKKAIEMAKEMGWYNRFTLITFNASTAKRLRDYDPGVQVGFLNTVERYDNEGYWKSVNSYLASGVGLASQLTTITREPLQESNARGQMYWLWTFDTGNSSQLATLIKDGNAAYTTNYVPYFSHNKYKLLADNNLTLGNNETKKFSATSVTYMKEENVEEDVEMIVLSDNATANGNSLTRTGSGDIYVIFKHKTPWTLYSITNNFYIYSDVVVIK